MMPAIALLAASISTSDCSSINLSGLYACNLKQSKVGLEIHQIDEQFKILFHLPDGSTQSETLIADGARRTHDDGSINQYVARCEKNQLLMDDFIGMNREASTYATLTQGPVLLRFEKGRYVNGRRERKATMTCRLSE